MERRNVHAAVVAVSLLTRATVFASLSCLSDQGHSCAERHHLCVSPLYAIVSSMSSGYFSHPIIIHVRPRRWLCCRLGCHRCARGLVCRHKRLWLKSVSVRVRGQHVAVTEAVSVYTRLRYSRCSRPVRQRRPRSVVCHVQRPATQRYVMYILARQWRSDRDRGRRGEVYDGVLF